MAGRRGVLLVLCAMAAGVAGVAGCDSSEPGATASVTSPPPPSSVAPSPSLDSTGDLVGGVAPADLCAFLGSDLPRLREQSTVGALARLAADVSDFYATQGLRRPDGAVIDKALRRACPDVRNATLAAVGESDLRSL